MAQGDITLFNQFKEDLGGKLHDLNTDDIYYSLNTSVLSPDATTSDPRYGTGGGTDLTSTEVAQTSGSYAAGGANIAPADAWTRSAGTCTFDLDNISLTQNASNPTAARNLFMYNFADAGKRAIGFLDLGADTDMTTGDFSVTWNGSGVFTLA